MQHAPCHPKVDGTQSIGVLPLDVDLLHNVAVMACSVHKWLCCPYGMVAQLRGWEGGESGVKLLNKCAISMFLCLSVSCVCQPQVPLHLDTARRTWYQAAQRIKLAVPVHLRLSLLSGSVGRTKQDGKRGAHLGCGRVNDGMWVP